MIRSGRSDMLAASKLHVYSDFPLPRTLRYRGICISRDFSRAMSLRESLHWGSFDGNVILEIQSKFGPYVQTTVETIKTSSK